MGRVSGKQFFGLVRTIQAHARLDKCSLAERSLVAATQEQQMGRRGVRALRPCGTRRAERLSACPDSHIPLDGAPAAAIRPGLSTERIFVLSRVQSLSRQILLAFHGGIELGVGVRDCIHTTTLGSEEELGTKEVKGYESVSALLPEYVS